MILSGRSIQIALNSGNWSCNFDFKSPEVQYGPNSVDVTLSDTFLVPTSPEGLWDRHSLSFIDLTRDTVPDSVGNEIPLSDALFSKVVVDEYILNPGEFILSSVNESFDCREPLYIKQQKCYFAPMYEGRSTIARVGVQSHISAAFGDYGFNGSFTLEIVNNSPWPIKLFKGMRIGQVYFVEVDDRVVDHPYNGYDQTDSKPQGPRLGSGRV